MLRENAHLAAWIELILAVLSLLFLIYQTFFVPSYTIKDGSL